MTAVDSVLRWWRNGEHLLSVQTNTPEPESASVTPEPAWLAPA